VIRDQKTDDSLGYAFIEFETEAQCEQAYLKVDLLRARRSPYALVSANQRAFVPLFAGADGQRAH
jgi:RNA recognition motif-containing protein